MPDKASVVEKTGIEHVPEEARHGSPGRVFTLWFPANLTIIDYVIGVLAVDSFGLTFSQALPVLLAGNRLGGRCLASPRPWGPSSGSPRCSPPVRPSAGGETTSSEG